MVWIDMARRATHILETEGKNLVAAASRSNLVAFRASYRGMGPAKREACVAMFGDAEAGTMEIQNTMAILAAVLIRSRSELAVVFVLVAVCAGCEFHFVDSVFARR